MTTVVSCSTDSQGSMLDEGIPELFLCLHTEAPRTSVTIYLHVKYYHPTTVVYQPIYIASTARGPADRSDEVPFQQLSSSDCPCA